MKFQLFFPSSLVVKVTNGNDYSWEKSGDILEIESKAPDRPAFDTLNKVTFQSGLTDYIIQEVQVAPEHKHCFRLNSEKTGFYISSAEAEGHWEVYPASTIIPIQLIITKKDALNVTMIDSPLIFNSKGKYFDTDISITPNVESKKITLTLDGNPGIHPSEGFVGFSSIEVPGVNTVLETPEPQIVAKPSEGEYAVIEPTASGKLGLSSVQIKPQLFSTTLDIQSNELGNCVIDIDNETGASGAWGYKQLTVTPQVDREVVITYDQLEQANKNVKVTFDQKSFGFAGSIHIVTKQPDGRSTKDGYLHLKDINTPISISVPQKAVGLDAFKCYIDGGALNIQDYITTHQINDSPTIAVKTVNPDWAGFTEIQWGNTLDNLSADNIRKGRSILGIEGTYDPVSGLTSSEEIKDLVENGEWRKKIQEGNKTFFQVDVHDDKYAKIDITDIVAQNIADGKSILGVAGNFTSDADLSAGVMLVGHSGYAQGQKVSGTIVTFNPATDITGGTVSA